MLEKKNGGLGLVGRFEVRVVFGSGVVRVGELVVLFVVDGGVDSFGSGVVGVSFGLVVIGVGVVEGVGVVDCLVVPVVPVSGRYFIVQEEFRISINRT